MEVLLNYSPFLIMTALATPPALEQEAPQVSAFDALTAELEGDPYAAVKNLLRVMDETRANLASSTQNPEKDFNLLARAFVFRAEVASRRLGPNPPKGKWEDVVEPVQKLVFQELMQAIAATESGAELVAALERARAHQEEVMRTLHEHQIRA